VRNYGLQTRLEPEEIAHALLVRERLRRQARRPEFFLRRLFQRWEKIGPELDEIRTSVRDDIKRLDR